MAKIKPIDIVIFSLLFIACVSFPYATLNIPIWAKYTLKIAFELVLLISYILMIRKYKISIYGNANIKNLLLMTPLILVLVVNFITIPFASSVVFNQGSISSGVFFFELALAFIQPILEEIVFRLLIHSQLPIKNKLLKILASAGIFAAVHLLNFFFNGFNTQYLIQVAYTFGLGIILGFIYEYGCSFIICCVFHILFNFFNTTIFNVLYSVYFENQLSYYMPVIVVTIISIVYMALIYFFIFRKQDREEISW